MYLLVYVDDMVITGNNNKLIDRFIATISSRFSLKDLGELSYFLGIEATQTSKGLHLMQNKYVIDLITRTNMMDVRPVSTPMAPTPKLSLTSGTPMENPSEYQAVLRSLQYLALTRPDIAFLVNRLSQYMQRPTNLHWQAVKRILRYLAETSAHGILLRADTPTLMLIGQVTQMTIAPRMHT